MTSAEFAISVGAEFDSYRVVLYPETPSSWGSNVVSSLVPPGSSHRGTRNIPQEVKNLRYSGLTEWGPLYLQFRHTAEYIMGGVKLTVCVEFGTNWVTVINREGSCRTR